MIEFEKRILEELEKNDATLDMGERLNYILGMIKREVKDFGDSIKCNVKFDYKPVGNLDSEFNVKDLYKDRGIK